jgi:hypothetical protein
MVLAIFHQETLTKTIRQVCVTNCLYLATCTYPNTHILKIAGSINLIKIIPPIRLIVYANYSKLSEFFKILGWFMLITSPILYIVPRRIHHAYPLTFADILTPLNFQIISPFAFLFEVNTYSCVSDFVNFEFTFI